MKINYYFMVCKALHEKRTRPLYNTVIKRIKECGDNFYLLGGFEQFDDIPIHKVTDYDDYKSCVEKIDSVFQREWDDADWHMICDDDTFIHTANLKKFIEDNKSDKAEVFTSNIVMPVTHGGAGILMNKKTFTLFSNYVRKNGMVGIRGDGEEFSDVSLDKTINVYNKHRKREDRIYKRYPSKSKMLDSVYATRKDYINEELEFDYEVKDSLISMHIRNPMEFLDEKNIDSCVYHLLEKHFFGK